MLDDRHRGMEDRRAPMKRCRKCERRLDKDFFPPRISRQKVYSYSYCYSCTRKVGRERGWAHGQKKTEYIDDPKALIPFVWKLLEAYGSWADVGRATGIHPTVLRPIRRGLRDKVEKRTAERILRAAREAVIQ